MLRSLAEMFELVSLKEEVTQISAMGLAMEFAPVIMRPYGNADQGEGSSKVHETMQLLAAGTAPATFLFKLSEHLLGRVFYISSSGNV